MNINFYTMDLNSICEGCLSTDRKLRVVYDTLAREVFSNCIGELDYINNTLALCWECMAIIKKIIKFKQQVQNAHRYLIEYMLHQSKLLPSLSNLTTHTNTQESHIYESDSLETREKSSPLRSKRIVRYTTHCDIKIDEKDSSIHLSQNINHKENIAKSEKDIQDKVIVSAKEREPVFIKVENESDNNFVQELEFGEVFDNFYADDGENDLKVVLNSEPKQYELKSISNSKNSRSETETEFNESDDEPLKKKESKPKGRRKKKEKANKSGSRERAPGVVESACAARTLHKLGVPPGMMQAVRLSWQEVEEERQKALASDSFLRHEHRCSDCVLGFNHRSKLDNHMKKHQTSAGDLMCSVCRVRSQTQHALTAHRRRHRIRWRCCACGELGSRAGVIADHCARVHNTAAPIHTCPVCGDTAQSLSKLRNHLKNHGERQKCELCGKTFRDKSTLKTHLFIHKGEKEHACPTCGKMFLFKKAMQLHAATHDASALLYCHECDMNFKNQMSYYQHMKYNLKHVDPARLKYECGQCGKKFMKASRLSEHTTAVHLKLTPIPCPEPACTFACASRAVLRAHLRTIHRQQRAPRNHVCHACGKAYTNKKTLEGHLRTHSGERPFACARCGATFGYHAALYNHTRLVHLKHKPPRREPTANVSWPAAPALGHNAELS